MEKETFTPEDIEAILKEALHGSLSNSRPREGSLDDDSDCSWSDSEASGSFISGTDESDCSELSPTKRKRSPMDCIQEDVRGSRDVPKNARTSINEIISKLGFFIDQLTKERAYYESIAVSV